MKYFSILLLGLVSTNYVSAGGYYQYQPVAVPFAQPVVAVAPVLAAPVPMPQPECYQQPLAASDIVAPTYAAAPVAFAVAQPAYSYGFAAIPVFAVAQPAYSYGFAAIPVFAVSSAYSAPVVAVRQFRGFNNFGSTNVVVRGGNFAAVRVGNGVNVVVQRRGIFGFRNNVIVRGNRVIVR